MLPPPAPKLNSKRRKQLRNRLPQVCVKCGATENLTLDHIVARALGGTNELCNLQILCQVCQSKKAAFESLEACGKKSKK